MAVTINCAEPLTLEGDANTGCTIKDKDVELSLGLVDEIVRIDFCQEKKIEYSGGEVEKTCKIYIRFYSGVSYTFSYPYELSELASTEFDKLVSFLKPILCSKP